MSKTLVPKFFQKLFRKKYHYRNIDDIPTTDKENIIYVVQEGAEPETLVFICPCGCQDLVYLNLLRDAYPCWTFKIERRKISIFPSILRKKGCRSHYWIKKGIVIWAK